MMSKKGNGRTSKREASGAGGSSPIPSSSALRRARILVVGDVMLDRYWFGDVSRISPEAPVPVVKFKRNEERPGGAANVARNAAALGARVTLLSVVGDDEPGHRLSELLRRRKNHRAPASRSHDRHHSQAARDRTAAASTAAH
jgi:rfaE bifunctional protein kinase chain/domain